MKDEIYIEAVKNGNKRAYAHLVDKYCEKVHALAFSITGNREDAQEVAQDAFVKAYSNLRSFRKDSTFSTWLYRITYNAAVSLVRKRPEYLPIGSDGPEERSGQEDPRMEKVRKAMQKLNAREQTVMNLFYLNECKLEEIAEMTGLSVANIKVILYRGREKLKGMLEVRNDDRINVSP